MMKIVFRVDAALHIGSGHVMRCLTLADELKKQGATCFFICRVLPGHLCELIEQRGYQVYPLPALEATFEPMKGQYVPHAHWLGASARQDALETIDILKNEIATSIDTLIIDHYALDAQWESELAQFVDKIVVIDDLADRQHHCDILLDQTFGRQADEYQPLVKPSSKLLLGSRYALLRPEFLTYRASSIENKKQTKSLSHIVITMGGVDKDNCTELVLDAISASTLPHHCRITVVLGEKAPFFDVVKQKSALLPWQIDVKSNVTNMAELMSSCDLAIGAAGTTAWERCALAIPSIVISTAENQEDIATTLSKEGVHWYIGKQSSLNAAMIASVINHAMIDTGARYAMAQHAQQICDAKGASRVTKAILKREVAIRRAEMSDAKTLHHWRNRDVIRHQSFNTQKIPLAQHVAWMEARLRSEETCLLIAMIDDEPIGCVRFDFEHSTAEISLYLSPDYLGAGYGTHVLIAAQRWLKANYPAMNNIDAKIKETNIASKSVFERAGYQLTYCAYKHQLS